MKANTILAAVLMMLSCASANVMANGTRVFEAKYDPWGVQTIVTDSIHFHRGYGGHEMLNYFGIINMRSAQRDAFITKWRKNGRLYDPVLGRFLSPDNYVQEPFNTQNLNRYSYCLNNPVKYTDPSGNFHLPSFLKFWKAAFAISAISNPFKHGFNFSEWDMHLFNRAVKLTASTVQGRKTGIVNDSYHPIYHHRQSPWDYLLPFTLLI